LAAGDQVGFEPGWPGAAWFEEFRIVEVECFPFSIIRGFRGVRFLNKNYVRSLLTPDLAYSNSRLKRMEFDLQIPCHWLHRAIRRKTNRIRT
jgi:hypothetical protein